MNKQQKQEAKLVLIASMQEGKNWQEAAMEAKIEVKRSTAYTWFKRYREQGEAGLTDGRHGHVAKMSSDLLKLIETMCTEDPSLPSSVLRERLIEQNGRDVSVPHLNRTRAAHGWTRTKPTGKKKQKM